MNPFSQNDQGRGKSIPEILDLLRKVDFGLAFGRQNEIKISKLYTVLTSDLGVGVTLGDLKNLNQFLINRQAQELDEDLEFMSRDESIVDLPFL